MYERLTDRLMRKCKEGKLSNVDGCVYSFSGILQGQQLNVDVTRSKHGTNLYIVKHKGKEYSFTSLRSTDKFFTEYFLSIRNEEFTKTSSKENTSDADKNDKVNDETCDKACYSGIIESESKNKYVQVGDYDETMPSADTLYDLFLKRFNDSEGNPGGEQLSNFNSGRINIAMKENNIYDRYRLVYLNDEYYTYDKRKMCLLTVSELRGLLPAACEL